MTEQMTDRNRWIALYVLCAGVLMIVLDVTVVNVALPSIQDDLGFSQSSLAWVVNAYLISFGGLLLLSGRFGDLIGRKDVFMAGLVVFIAASILCGAAQSQEMLVAARFIQGIGGAMTSAVVLGMIVTMFPAPRDQAKAIGVYGFVASAGGTIGLLAGGVLTQAINWHWIFFINIPIGVATAALAWRLIERDKGIGLSEGADVPGRGADHRLADARRVHDRQAGGRRRLGGAHDPPPRRPLGRPAGCVHRPRGHGSHAADPAADLPLAQPLGREHRPAAARGRDVRTVLHGRPLHGARARLRPAADRLRLPAGHARDGNALAPVRRDADHALRREDDAAPGTGADRGRPGALHAHARGRQLRRAHPARDARARGRHRRLVPGPDDARHVGRHPGGRGPGVRAS